VTQFSRKGIQWPKAIGTAAFQPLQSPFQIGQILGTAEEAFVNV